MDALLGYAAQAHARKDGLRFAEVIILHANHHLFPTLQNDLIENDLEVRPAVLRYFPGDDKTDIVDLLCLVLEFVTDSNDTDAVQKHESLLVIFRHALGIFQLKGPSVAWFIPSLRKICTQLVVSALNADSALGNPYMHIHTEAVARALHTPFSLAAADSSTHVPERRGATFFLANLIFQMYFAIDNIRLCDTIMKNLERQLKRIDEFSRADQTMYYFWRGRILLSRRELRPADEHFTRSFHLCTNQNPSTKRSILIYTVGASLPLGKFPQQTLLEHFKLEAQFGTLIKAIKLGDLALFRETLSRWRRWFARRGLWLLLRERCEVLTWRSLVRRTFLCTRNRPQLPLLTDARPQPQPPNVLIVDLLRALRYSARDSGYTTLDVQSMLFSMLDQKYILGYLHHSRVRLVLQRAAPWGFPAPGSVVLPDTADLDKLEGQAFQD